MMTIIDCHTHISTGASKVYHSTDTPEDMINDLKHNHVSGAIFRPMAAASCGDIETLELENEEALELYRKHPDFLYPGITLNPLYYEKSLYYMDKFCEMGLVWTGENLSGKTKIFFNDDRWIKIFQSACERRMIVQLHNVPEVASVAEKLPDLTIIGSHLYPEVLPLLTKFPNVYIDISGIHGGLCRGYLRYAKELFGIDRLLFGSDFPGYDVLPFIELCKRDFTLEEQTKIFSGNLFKLLNFHGVKRIFGVDLSQYGTV